jgi:hypothetical protein
MVASICGLAAIVLLIGTTVCAAAPRIPPTDQPGRERQRFVDPPGFREIAPRPSLLIPESGAKRTGKRKCRMGRSGKRKRC